MFSASSFGDLPDDVYMLVWGVSCKTCGIFALRTERAGLSVLGTAGSGRLMRRAHSAPCARAADLFADEGVVF